MNGFFALTGDDKVDKRNPVIIEMKRRIDEQYENGRNTVMGDSELEEMLKEIDFDYYRQVSHIHINRRK